MVSSLVNKDNSHVGNLLSSNQGAVKGFGGKVIGADGSCKGIKQYGGKKHKKHTKKKKSKKRKNKRSMRNKRKSKKRFHKKKTHKKHNRKNKKKSRKYKKKGGAVLEPHRPLQGLHSILTRGGNASRGLSNAEKAKLNGGGMGYGMTANNATTQANAGTPSGIGMGNHNSAGITITGYKNCNITPDFKHGAGSNWQGLDKIQIGAGMVDKYNNMTAGAYGYVPDVCMLCPEPYSAVVRYIVYVIGVPDRPAIAFTPWRQRIGCPGHIDSDVVVDPEVVCSCRRRRGVPLLRFKDESIRGVSCCVIPEPDVVCRVGPGIDPESKLRMVIYVVACDIDIVGAVLDVDPLPAARAVKGVMDFVILDNYIIAS